MEQIDHDELSPVVTHLMRGILYKEEKPHLWESLEKLEGAVRDYLKVIGLDLEIYESDGFAFLKSRETGEGESSLPRLMARRQLTYSVSLILALLRRKLTEHDAFSGETRLILSLDEVRDMVSAFFPSGSNEVKALKRLDTHLARIQELGFIRFIGKNREKIEVRRILKAFIDAQWLSDFDARLEEYLEYGKEPDDE
ncbi:MAG: DUF4194 domain-containing protein [Spirochaetales bacterium]|nr:DUF4194 domain-containing protein [Spirochaetales bacterium]